MVSINLRLDDDRVSEENELEPMTGAGSETKGTEKDGSSDAQGQKKNGNNSLTLFI